MELQFHVNNGTANNNTTKIVLILSNNASPTGKASVSGASKCVDVDRKCSPGQYITVFADKSFCYDVPINYYCSNGRCLHDCSIILSAATRKPHSNWQNLYCVGSTGNICDPSYRTDGPRASSRGATACTSSASGYIAGMYTSNNVFTS